MKAQCADVVVDRPALSAVVVAVVATLAYVGIQLALDGTVARVETATFVTIFTAIYVGGNWVLREQVLDTGGEGTGDSDPAVAESADGAE